jgi:hypothetical protein
LRQSPERAGPLASGRWLGCIPSGTAVKFATNDTGRKSFAVSSGSHDPSSGTKPGPIMEVSRPDLESSMRDVALLPDVNGAGRSVWWSLLSTALASTWPSFSDVAIRLASSPGLSERPAGRRVTSPKVALMDPPGFTRYLVFDRDHRLLLADDLAGPWEPPINLAGIQYVPLVVLSLASRPRMPN